MYILDIELKLHCFEQEHFEYYCLKYLSITLKWVEEFPQDRV